MINFSINFIYPWLLLLLIPAIALPFWFYFKQPKKYRRTRNRICSLVLHLIALVLCANVLSGVVFAYETYNTDNELMIVVDVSHSSISSQDEKNDFVRAALNANEAQFQMGIITFARDAKYVARFSSNADAVYFDYLDSLSGSSIDNSGTNIAAALNLAKQHIKNPSTAKIILVSDGIETDGSALTAIASIVSAGTKVDTVYFANSASREVQIMSIDTSEQVITKDVPTRLSVSLYSTYSGPVTISLFDNDKPGQSVEKVLTGGVDKYWIDHTFTEYGMHKLRVEIQSDGDNLEQNNTYYTYIMLGEYNNILIIDNGDESQMLKQLSEDQGYRVTVANTTEIPTNIDDLIEYHQIILVNIANSQMWDGMDVLLDTYVRMGGGLLTIGGNKTVTEGPEVRTIANAYNYNEMYDASGNPSLYQQMLPVDCVEYVPSLALMLVIDVSSSMLEKIGEGEKTRLEKAKEGAIECIEALNPRDYCGVVSFSNNANPVIALTPVTQKTLIRDAIIGMVANGETFYNTGITMAVSQFLTETQFDRKHIMFITDGEPSESTSEYGLFMDPIEKLSEKGITLSTIAIGNVGESGKSVLAQMATAGGGKTYSVSDNASLAVEMRRDITIPAIKDYIPEEFSPTIRTHTSVVKGVSTIPNLGGIYGAKAKESAVVTLMGAGSPLYAEWKLGKGKVGSFMCDLSGKDKPDGWSSDFWQEEDSNGVKNGVLIIQNILAGLFPTHALQPQLIDVDFLTPRNYQITTNIITDASEGETVSISVKNPLGQPNATPIAVTKSGLDFFRCEISVDIVGIYEIIIVKTNTSGAVVSQLTTHTAFSYSSEYSVYQDPEREKPEAFLQRMAREGKGEFVAPTEPERVFENLSPSSSHTVDPYIVLIVIILTLFLLDIAVRKFKFKWPHEIIRDRKLKKEILSGGNKNS